jgi:hypothetical protein
MGRACSIRGGEGRVVYRTSVGNLEGYRPMGRPGPRWEDNVDTDLEEIWFSGIESMWLRIGTSGSHL